MLVSEYKEKDIIFNHFDLQKTRCPTNIIGLLEIYEKQWGIRQDEKMFLDFRNYYNCIIKNYFSLRVQQNNIINAYLIRTNITINRLQIKNLLCVGENNIINANDFNNFTGCVSPLTFSHINLTDMEIDVIGGNTLYMLIKNYNWKYNKDYQNILKLIIGSWNDYVLQSNYEKILTPGTTDFIDYLSILVEQWYQNGYINKLYNDKSIILYQKFVNYETIYL